MMHKDTSDLIFSIFWVLCLFISFAWVGLLFWAVVQLISWITTK